MILGGNTSIVLLIMTTKLCDVMTNDYTKLSWQLFRRLHCANVDMLRCTNVVVVCVFV